MDLSRVRRILRGLMRRATSGVTPERATAMARLALRCDPHASKTLPFNDVYVEALADAKGGASVAFTARRPDGAFDVVGTAPETEAIVRALVRASSDSRSLGTTGGSPGRNVTATLNATFGKPRSATLRAAAAAAAEKGRAEAAQRLAAMMEAHGMPFAARLARRVGKA